MRFLLLATVCLIPSTLFGQLDKFGDKDIGKLAAIARGWQQLDGFDWTPQQYDKLARETVQYQHLTGPHGIRVGRRADDDDRRQFLEFMYEVMDDEQEARLHQIFFQRFMNRDQLKLPLQAFAPNTIEDLDSKLKKLQEEIDAKLEEVTASLPKIDRGLMRDRKNHELAQEKLAAFLDWRWKLQTKWLRNELGEETTKKLIGEPILIGYQFLVSGDPNNPGGTDAFGGLPWGGSWYSSRTTGMTRSGTGPDRIITLGVGNFDPTTGKVRERKHSRENRYGMLDGPKPPVRVPAAMTLAKAEAELARLENEMQTRSVETGASIAAMRQDMRNALPSVAGQNFRASMAQQRLMEADLQLEVSLMQVDITKWRRIIEELGGDPNATRKAISAARRLFSSTSIVRCSYPTFLVNINPTADQCDALEKLATEIGVPNIKNDAEMEIYIDRVREILDPQQTKIFNQQIFRACWFSDQALKAIGRTKLKLTQDQISKVEDLVERYKTAQEDQRGRRQLTIHLRAGLGGRDESYLIEFAKEFPRVLEEIIGSKNARELLGEPFDYETEWKRPVKIPAGMTLAQLEVEYQELVEQKQKIDKKAMEAIGGYGGGFGRRSVFQLSEEEMETKRREYEALTRKLEIAKRIVEELKKTE